MRDVFVQREVPKSFVHRLGNFVPDPRWCWAAIRVAATQPGAEMRLDLQANGRPVPRKGCLCMKFGANQPRSISPKTGKTGTGFFGAFSGKHTRIRIAFSVRCQSTDTAVMAGMVRRGDCMRRGCAAALSIGWNSLGSGFLRKCLRTKYKVAPSAVVADTRGASRPAPFTEDTSSETELRLSSSSVGCTPTRHFHPSPSKACVIWRNNA